MRALGEAVVRLVEADMAVAADAEQLNIHIAHTAKHRIIAGALLFLVRLHAVRQIDMRWVNVHMVKKVVMHEIMIALVVFRLHAVVFIQIDRSHIRKIQIALFVPLDQLLICADRRRTGGKTEHGIRLEDDLRRNDICRLAAHVLIILCTNNSHNEKASKRL